ncbi:MAG: DUF1045 domain-containing protein [Rhodospirillales bacterium]
MKRYAIYFAPPRGSALWSFGNSWLGRDVETGEELRRPAIIGLEDVDIDELTSSPSLYGFHATIKPPFRLSNPFDLGDLVKSLEEFAAARKSFECSLAGPSEIGNFIAFVLDCASTEMDRLASEAVEFFDLYRSPLTDEELRKRRSVSLTSRQEENLQNWGYPYVKEDFRFHMTLTNAVKTVALRSRLKEALSDAAQTAGVIGPTEISGLALYEQPGLGMPFKLLRRFPFQN